MQFLGLDIGSSSVKASVLDGETGVCLASVSHPEVELQINAPQAGWAEQDPDTWWESIKEAKNRGMKYYNFWGIAPDKARKNHPFYGITHFKKGFGGYKKELLPAQDLPVSVKYWFNWVIETFRSIKRGFK